MKEIKEVLAHIERNPSTANIQYIERQLKFALTKAENLPISDVVLLSSLDVGDRFAIEDEEDIIGDDYYEVLGKSTTSILCKKPSGRNDRYFPETRVKRI